MPEYKSAEEIPLDKAIEAIMSGALRAVAAQPDDEVEGFIFEIVAGGRIGPRGGFPPIKQGTAPGPTGGGAGGTPGAGSGAYGA